MIELKFLVDECVGIIVARWLQENYSDVVSILDGMSGTKDSTILEKACTENRIVITNDKDFGDLVFQKKMPHTGVILLRLQNDSSKNRIAALEKLFEAHFHELQDNFTVISDVGIRIIKQVFN